MKKICFDTFRVKTLSGGEDVMIEGFANKAVIDRGNDLIEPKAWKLDNYKKNPILLFAHDPAKPVGKALDVKATEDGLLIKARLSRSKDPTVSLVRDLVKEGILNSFSVGFDAKHAEKSAEGANVIKDAELMEVSIVSIPMNQDSTFSVTAKDLRSMTLKEARVAVLKAKGDDNAAKVAEIIASGQELSAVAEKAGMAEAALIDAMASGAVTAEILKAVAPDESDPQEPVDAPAQAQNPYGEVCIQSVLVPKAMAGTAEEAAAWAEQNGFEAANVIDAGEFWQLDQEAKELFASAEFTAMDLGGGVRAMVGVMKPENSESAEMEEKAAPVQEAPTVPVTATPDPSMVQENPYLDLAKQTNVLLAQVVNELQIVSKKLDGMTAMPAPMRDEMASPEEKQADPITEKIMEIARIQSETMSRLRRLGA